MSDHHDSLFKALCQNTDEARGVLKAALPPALLQKLDLSVLEPADPNLLDHHLTWRYSDFLYRTSVAGRETFLWVLWEHQSTQDDLMPLRVLILMSRIWDRWLKREEKRRKERGDHSRIKRVPAILPVVLYQGPGRWSAATELLEVLDLSADILGVVQAHMPSFRFLLDDLSVVSDEALRERETGAFGKLVLLLLKHAREEQEALFRSLQGMRDLINALESDHDRITVFSYILEVAQTTAQHLTKTLAGDLSHEAREAVVTAAEKLRIEGALGGQRLLLLRLLRRKFRELPAEVEARVGGASELELHAWSDRVLDVSTLDEVFAESET